MPTTEEKFLLFIGITTMTPFFCVVYYHINEAERMKEEWKNGKKR